MPEILASILVAGAEVIVFTLPAVTAITLILLIAVVAAIVIIWLGV